MKNIWIFLFLSIIFKRTHAMEGDQNGNEFTDKRRDAPKIKHKEVNDLKIIQTGTIEISPDDSKELKKKFREILKAPKDPSKDELVSFDFLKILPNSLNKCKENYDITARPDHLFYLLEHRRANERERILQKCMKSFEFGADCREEYALNNLIAFPDSKSIVFYNVYFNIGNDFRTKEVYFQLHWKRESFPVLIEFEQKKFLFRTVFGDHFFYCDLNDRAGEYIEFDLNFESSGKCPFKVKKASLLKPPTHRMIQNIEVFAAHRMIQNGVWFDVDEIKEALEKMHKMYIKSDNSRLVA